MIFIYILLALYLVVGLSRAFEHLKYAVGSSGALVTIITITIFWPFIKTYSKIDFEYLEDDDNYIKTKEERESSN